MALDMGFQGKTGKRLSKKDPKNMVSDKVQRIRGSMEGQGGSWGSWRGSQFGRKRITSCWKV